MPQLYPTSPVPLSMSAMEAGIPLEEFNGYRIVCDRCRAPFRCFRADETHCGCCRHMKDVQ